jgi:hypothetical protein
MKTRGLRDIELDAIWTPEAFGLHGTPHNPSRMWSLDCFAREVLAFRDVVARVSRHQSIS